MRSGKDGVRACVYKKWELGILKDMNRLTAVRPKSIKRGTARKCRLPNHVDRPGLHLDVQAEALVISKTLSVLSALVSGCHGRAP